MTYSIVARDARTGELGVAVRSHWFAVGSLVTWAEADASPPLRRPVPTGLGATASSTCASTTAWTRSVTCAGCWPGAAAPRCRAPRPVRRGHRRPHAHGGAASFWLSPLIRRPHSVRVTSPVRAPVGLGGGRAHGGAGAAGRHTPWYAPLGAALLANRRRGTRQPGGPAALAQETLTER